MPLADKARFMDLPADVEFVLISDLDSYISVEKPNDDKYVAITGPDKPAPIREMFSLVFNGILEDFYKIKYFNI